MSYSASVSADCQIGSLHGLGADGDGKVLESTSSCASKKRALPAGIGQRTLQQCKKKVILRGHTAMNFKTEHILACKKILEDKSSTTEDKLEQLRILSVMQVSQEHLLESKIGHLVRKMCKDANTEVARLAQRLLDKWKGQVLQERCAKGKVRSGKAKSGNTTSQVACAIGDMKAQ